MEIRAPRPDELEDMLELMCRAFDLDVDQARDIFYSDPLFDLLERRVLVEGKKLVSCLTIVPGVFVLGGARIPLAGIAGVATDEAFRRKGYAAALLRDTILLLHQKKVPLAMLFPFSARYYRKFGWEIASVEWWCDLPAMLLPPFQESQVVRAYREGDLPYLQRLHDIHLSNSSGSFERDPLRWYWILRQRYQTVLADFQGSVEGYMIYDWQGGRRRVEVREIIFTTSRAQRALLGYLVQLENVEVIGVYAPVSRVQHWTSWLTSVPDEALSQAQGGLRPTYMLRITHLPALIDCLRPRWKHWQGSIRLIVEDSFVPAGKQEVTIQQGEQAASPAGWARGSIQTWSQIVGGYLNASEAASAGLLTASSMEVILDLDDLFPKYYPFTTVAERF